MIKLEVSSHMHYNLIFFYGVILNSALFERIDEDENYSASRRNEFRFQPIQQLNAIVDGISLYSMVRFYCLDELLNRLVKNEARTCVPQFQKILEKLGFL